MNDLAKRDGEARRSASLRRYLPLALGLCVGVMLSVVAFMMVRGWEQGRIRSEFELQSSNLMNALEDGLTRHLGVLYTLEYFFLASQYVDRQEFAKFTEGSLSFRHGVQALEWVPRVPDSKRSAYEEAARRDGQAGFRIFERDPEGKIVKATRREEYFPVYYVEPLKGNEAALGFDVASGPDRLQALERARDTGEATATGRITLVQETGEQAGVLVFVPIYRNGLRHDTLTERRINLHGFALGVFRIGDLVEASLRGVKRWGIEIHLLDTSVKTHEQFLYGSESPERPLESPRIVKEIRTDSRTLHWSRTLGMAGRQWSLRFYPTPEFVAAHSSWRPWGALAGGLLATALLGGYLLLALGRSAEVERLVVVRTSELASANRQLEDRIIEGKRMEEALRASEDRYRDLVEHSEDFICTHDLEGRLLSVNQALVRRFGYEREEELLGRKISDFLAPDSRHLFDAYLDTVVKAGYAQGFMKVMTRSGEERVWEYHNSLRTEGLETPIVRGRSHDVTERVWAEKALAERAKAMQALRAITVEITQQLDLTTLLDLVTRRGAELVGVASGAIYLWDEATQVLSPEAWCGLGEWMKGLRLGLGEGVAGAVAQRRRGLIVNDFQTSSYASPPFLERTGFTAVVAEPLLYHDQLIGVLAINNEGFRQGFTEEHGDLLDLFAAQAAIAIENARLYSDLEKSKQKIAELHNLGMMLQEPLSLEDRLDVILTGAETVLGFDRINILLPDSDKKMLRAIASRGTKEPLERLQVPLGPEGGGIAIAFMECKDIVWEGTGPVPDEWRLAHPYSEIVAFRSRAFVNVPLIVRGTVIGVLGADNKFSQKPISVETIHLLKDFAAHAAITIDNARLYDEVSAHAKELEQKVEERTKALKETQVQLIQSGKLAAVGTLAAGVAHELNQPLMVIRGYAQELLADKRLADQELREDLRRIEAQTTRMVAIITHLRDFSRQSKGRREPTDLNHVVTQAFTFLAQQLKVWNIEVIQELDPAL
ncbi:MAG TPA: CHASE domain-containing protein, partial [Candidatus Methylomirabilis sp.]|nr:CHASE domain-containing protein [Candidatus Methylomirabilis sp.]